MGPPYIMHREDLETVAPLWYHFTKQVRNDPEVSTCQGRGACVRLYCSTSTRCCFCSSLPAMEALMEAGCEEPCLLRPAV